MSFLWQYKNFSFSSYLIWWYCDVITGNNRIKHIKEGVLMWFKEGFCLSLLTAMTNFLKISITVILDFSYTRLFCEVFLGTLLCRLETNIQGKFVSQNYENNFCSNSPLTLSASVLIVQSTSCCSVFVLLSISFANPFLANVLIYMA